MALAACDGSDESKQSQVDEYLEAATDILSAGPSSPNLDEYGASVGRALAEWRELEPPSDLTHAHDEIDKGLADLK